MPNQGIPVLRCLIKSCSVLILLGCISVGSVRAETIPSTVVYQKHTGGSYFADGDAACLALAGELSTGASYWLYVNGEFFDKPDYGEGCQYDLVRQSDGFFQGRYHYQNWVNSRKTCPGGYNGPYINGLGESYCEWASASNPSKNNQCDGP